MKAFLFVLSFITVTTAMGQYNVSTEIDPKAKSILDNIHKSYKSYSSIYAEFELTLELPGQPAELQKGTVKQSGQKYFAQVGDQAVYCNGKYIYVHLKSNNEVHINDYDPEEADEGIKSPMDMMRLYEKGEYAYAVVGEEKENGRNVTLIEFKPLDRQSEYSKLRLAVVKGKNEISSLKVFSRDGSRYTLAMNKFIPNKAFKAGEFEFSVKDHPGVHVEDLRID